MGNIQDRAGEPMLFVVVGLARDALIASANRRLRFDLLAVCVLGVGLLTAVWLATHWLIKRPVDQLVRATAALARGELQARAPIGGGTPQFETLAIAFNYKADRLPPPHLHLPSGQRLAALAPLARGHAH